MYLWTEYGLRTSNSSTLGVSHSTPPKRSSVMASSTNCAPMPEVPPMTRPLRIDAGSVLVLFDEMQDDFLRLVKVGHEPASELLFVSLVGLVASQDRSDTETRRDPQLTEVVVQRADHTVATNRLDEVPVLVLAVQKVVDLDPVALEPVLGVEIDGA